jgi:hypothetical protein
MFIFYRWWKRYSTINRCFWIIFKFIVDVLHCCLLHYDEMLSIHKIISSCSRDELPTCPSEITGHIFVLTSQHNDAIVATSLRCATLSCIHVYSIIISLRRFIRMLLWWLLSSSSWLESCLMLCERGLLGSAITCQT